MPDRLGVRSTQVGEGAQLRKSPAGREPSPLRPREPVPRTMNLGCQEQG